MKNKLIIPVNNRVITMDKALRKWLTPKGQNDLGFFKCVLSTLQEPMTFAITPCSPRFSEITAFEQHLVNTFRLLLNNTYGINMYNDMLDAIQDIMRYIVQEILHLICQDTRSNTVYSVTCHIDVTDGNLSQVLQGVYLPIQLDYNPIA